MKIKLLLLLFGLLSILACNQRSGKVAMGSNSDKLNAEIDSVSYSIGVLIANNLKQNGFKEINLAAFDAAFAQVLNNDTAKLTIKLEAANMLVMGYSEKIYKQDAEKNKKDGEAFLAENKMKKDVMTTASGLQYIIIKEGTGPKPADTSIVKVHYTGKLIDGTVFESSYDQKQPAQFQVKGVVQGWQEALQMMTVGSKWTVFLPTELAYGENVRKGSKIGPNMVLIFELELLEIVPPKIQESAINPTTSKNTKKTK